MESGVELEDLALIDKEIGEAIVVAINKNMISERTGAYAIGFSGKESYVVALRENMVEEYRLQMSVDEEEVEQVGVLGQETVNELMKETRRLRVILVALSLFGLLLVCISVLVAMALK